MSQMARSCSVTVSVKPTVKPTVKPSVKPTVNLDSTQELHECAALCHSMTSELLLLMVCALMPWRFASAGRPLLCHCASEVVAYQPEAAASWFVSGLCCLTQGQAHHSWQFNLNCIALVRREAPKCLFLIGTCDYAWNLPVPPPTRYIPLAVHCTKIRRIPICSFL